MRARTKLLGGLVAALALALVGVGLRGGAPPASGPAAAAAVDPAAQVDSSIMFWAARAEGDSRDFVARNALAAGYLRRARLSADVVDYARAEETLLASLAARAEGNAGALLQLGAVRLAQHRFSDALRLAEEGLSLDPASALGHAVRGDAELALGLDARAEESYATLLDLAPGTAAHGRVALLREFRGDVEGARRAWLDASSGDATEPPEGVAWARSELGHLSFESGDPASSEAAYRSALEVLPGYAPALAGLGVLRAAERDYDAAIDLYRRAAERQPAIEHAIALGDLYAAAGRSELAAAQHREVAALASRYEAVGIDMDLTLARYFADHGLRPAEAVARARSGYATRPGPDGADALAWTLFQAGRHAEASGYAEESLAGGAADAAQLYHVGRIREANGDLVGAREALRLALERNPRFSVLDADAAAAALERVEATARQS